MKIFYKYIQLLNMKLKEKPSSLTRDGWDLNYYNISHQWLLGFIEAEGNFFGKKGQQPSFNLSQHAADKILMEAIANFIGHGNVRIYTREDGRSEAILNIYDKTVLRDIIIPMCLNNLKTKNKSNQFYSWLNAHFDDFTPSINPAKSSINKDWLVGFTDGDGSFYPMFHKSKDYKCGFQIQATFDLAQLDTDKDLLNSIGLQFFDNAHRWAKSGNTQHLRILKFDTHILLVEPFFSVTPKAFNLGNNLIF